MSEPPIGVGSGSPLARISAPVVIVLWRHLQRVWTFEPCKPARVACLLWLGWLAAWLACTVLAVGYGARDVEGPTAHASHPLATSLAHWTLWDGGYFIEIARHGYTHAYVTAFYPLYPLLIRGALWIVRPGSPDARALVALAVDQLAALAVLIGLALLAAEDAHQRGVSAEDRR